ncbi:MAG: hypothetical protein LBC28_01120 [Oscillospiraceae bacterium]|jgi:hypothetical protein|nr:hypothetical protein [Oscillospiraceae bacterium]
MLLRELSKVLQDGQEAELSTAVNVFSCKDKDVEGFLKTKAFEYERRKKSRTHIAFAEADELIILAYFTLSIKILTFKQGLSKTLIKRIDGFNKDAKAAPVFLIGQFGKDAVIGNAVDGSELMNRCLYDLKQAQKIVGGRTVLAECLPIPAVIEFYERNGFEFLQRDENDKYLQMIFTL